MPRGFRALRARRNRAAFCSPMVKRTIGDRSRQRRCTSRWHFDLKAALRQNNSPSGDTPLLHHAFAPGRHQVGRVVYRSVLRVHVPHEHCDSLVSGQRHPDFHWNIRIRDVRRSPVPNAMRVNKDFQTPYSVVSCRISTDLGCPTRTLRQRRAQAEQSQTLRPGPKLIRPRVNRGALRRRRAPAAGAAMPLRHSTSTGQRTGADQQRRAGGAQTQDRLA